MNEDIRIDKESAGSINNADVRSSIPEEMEGNDAAPAAMDEKTIRKMYEIQRSIDEHTEQRAQMEAMKQTVTMLIIDKKMMRLKDSGLPQVVIDQTPKLMRRNKLPIVKAKVGPRIMTLVADNKIYDIIPVKKEVKAVVSGIYIMDVRGIRGPLEVPEKKKGLRARISERLTGARNKANATAASAGKGTQKTNAVKKAKKN